MYRDDSIPPPHVLRRLAAAADVDPRTVARYLRGERVRVGAAAERIARVVTEAGLEASLPDAADSNKNASQKGGRR